MSRLVPDDVSFGALEQSFWGADIVRDKYYTFFRRVIPAPRKINAICRSVIKARAALQRSEMSHFSRIFLFELLTFHAPEPQAAMQAVRHDEIPKSRTAAPGVAPPAAAANNAVDAVLRSYRVCYTPAWIIGFPILAPLPHVPVHVVQAPGIGLLRSNGMCFTAAI